MNLAVGQDRLRERGVVGNIVPLRHSPRPPPISSHDLRDQLTSSIGASYVIERELGGGGMSRVFLATEARFQRQIVLKVFTPELAEGLSAERFEREIRVSSVLWPCLPAGSRRPAAGGARLSCRSHVDQTGRSCFRVG